MAAVTVVLSWAAATAGGHGDGGGDGDGAGDGAGAPTPSGRPSLADAPPVEILTLARLLEAPSWPRRALAAARLERYGGDESRDRLVRLLQDPAWQVRAYAIRSLGRRRVPIEPAEIAEEQNPRVIRAALRHRYTLESDRLARGVRTLADSSDTDERMLAAELGAASGDEDLAELARDVARTLILRMSRSEAGGLSPRLSHLTGEAGLRTPLTWQRWLLKQGRSFRVHPGYLTGDTTRPEPPALIANLDPERFAALEAYVERLADREVDLAIALDCTASMSGELRAAQAGIDDLVLFVRDVVKTLRFGLVAYRDRQDKFETKGWDFTDDLGAARHRLWQLTAEGGGDTPEAVYPAVKFALGRLGWDETHALVLILIGDAPPHVGYGGQTIDLVRRAAEKGLTTHAIETEGRPVEHFAEIAAAGGGMCVSLDDDDLLIPEIAGLTIGEAFAEEFREFFSTYLSLCR